VVVDVKGVVYVRSGMPGEILARDFVLEGVEVVWAVSSSRHSENMSFAIVGNESQVLLYDFEGLGDE
jgi:hypothetical protein